MQESEYEILKNIYATTPKEIKLGIKMDELFYYDELLMIKNNECRNKMIPKYYFELNGKTGFLYIDNNKDGTLADLYIEDKIYLLGFGKDVKLKEIMYILGNIELVEPTSYRLTRLETCISHRKGVNLC